MDYQCKVCKNKENNTAFTAREMLHGTRDCFTYIECSHCGCLQIEEVPSNIADYYPSNYYSYNIQKTFPQRVESFLLSSIINYRINKKNLLGFFYDKYRSVYRNRYLYPWLTKDVGSFDSDILDIGCGNGDLLLKMHQAGFKSLTGVDPYISEQINYYGKITIHKKELYEITDKFDLIMMHHSFEHMPESSRVLHHLSGMLKSKGTILIRIPVADCYAYRKYGVNWGALDAPRHFFLHTRKSMELLAEKNGLTISLVLYDSDESQFIVSDFYNKDIPLSSAGSMDKKNLRDYLKEAIQLNKAEDGDTACFYLKKKE